MPDSVQLSREARRTYDREWARAKRFKRWLAVNEGQTTCQYAVGKYRCGGRLTRHDGMLSCLWCSLKHAGLCRDCLTPIDRGPNTLRCDDCSIEERNAAERRYNARWPGKKNEEQRWRRLYWKATGDPRYAKSLDNKRLWRAVNPDKVREHKRREHEHPHNKARMLEYHRRRRAVYAKQRADRELLRYYGELPPRYCLGGCGKELTGRAKKCRNCKIGKFVVALETLGTMRAHPTLPIYGPWPTYADFRKVVSTPQNRMPARQPSAARDLEMAMIS